MAAASGANYNPVVALDVFLVQVCTTRVYVWMCDTGVGGVVQVAWHRPPHGWTWPHPPSPDPTLAQAATNTLLGHFVSLACSLWLLHLIGDGQGLRFQVRAQSDEGSK
jgi:hypothetical protein